MYSNSNLGFTLELPQSWEGKYIVKENSNEDFSFVEFLHKDIVKKNEFGGRIFHIDIFSSAQQNLSALGGKAIGSANGKHYYFFTPTDIQDEEATPEEKEEYAKMVKETEEIFKTVKVV